MADLSSLLEAIDSIATQVDRLQMQNSLFREKLRNRSPRSSEC
jgi:hypothetical protein